MCYLPPLIHQVHSGFHPPPIRPRYQSHLFFWLLFGANLSLRLKCCSHESQHLKFWWITRYLIAASCCTAGPSESSQSVQSDTVRHGEAVWICNDTCQEALSVYSQRWCEKDETESGWQEREKREHGHANELEPRWGFTSILTCLLSRR